MARYFPAIIEKASDGFEVFFPDLPGCTNAGATLPGGALNAEEALPVGIAGNGLGQTVDNRPAPFTW
jgi:predicted RNase H-like HicB family nuclease